jgi:hypothetical protein
MVAIKYKIGKNSPLVNTKLLNFYSATNNEVFVTKIDSNSGPMPHDRIVEGSEIEFKAVSQEVLDNFIAKIEGR